MKLWLGRLHAAVGSKMEASPWGCEQGFPYAACVLAARAATELSDSWSHPQRFYSLWCPGIYIFQSPFPRVIWTDWVHRADFVKHWSSILFDIKIQGETHGQVLRRVGVGTARKFHLFLAVQVFFYCFQLWVEINYPLFPNTSVLSLFIRVSKAPCLQLPANSTAPCFLLRVDTMALHPIFLQG